jgi:hypothetical protein
MVTWSNGFCQARQNASILKASCGARPATAARTRASGRETMHLRHAGSTRPATRLCPEAQRKGSWLARSSSWPTHSGPAVVTTGDHPWVSRLQTGTSTATPCPSRHKPAPGQPPSAQKFESMDSPGARPFFCTLCGLTEVPGAGIIGRVALQSTCWTGRLWGRSSR